MTRPAFVGIDVGTSGVRAVAIDADGTILGQGAARHDAFGADHRSPTVWWQATQAALDALLASVPPASVAAIAIDGTSGTMLPIDASGEPLATPLMYNDRVEDRAILDEIAALAPAESAAHGATSGLAKLILLQAAPGTVRVIHQADWIAGRLSGRFDVSDENNALKTGYDPAAGRWPDWIGATRARRETFPDVIEPGRRSGAVDARAAARFGLAAGTPVVAGTTDGCASFLATGASSVGDGVTALGSTMTIKLLSDRPVFAPEFGIYSHRLLGMWLPGGASNSGGAVLARFFDAATIASLSARIDPDRPTGLDYYPLTAPGERFPINDPALAPRLDPRPDDDARFLQGLLEGIAAIEALAYARLAELGAPALRSVRTVGGGAKNTVWSRIRAMRLGVAMDEPISEEAAAGTARLALIGAGATLP